jgi:hypothetical protein
MEFIGTDEYAGDATFSPNSETTVVLYESEDAAAGSVDNTGVLAVGLYDENSDSTSIADGTYDVVSLEEQNNASTPEEIAALIPGASFVGLLVGGGGGPTGSYDYVAGNSASASNAFPDVSADEFTEITGGSVQVSSSGGSYTLQWDLQTAGGQSISGSYSGAPDSVSTSL